MSEQKVTVIGGFSARWSLPVRQVFFSLSKSDSRCALSGLIALARDARVPAVLQRLDWTGEAQHHRENKKQDYLVLVDAHPIDLSVKPYDLLF